MRYALFVCPYKVGRSQMAEAFFERWPRRASGPSRRVAKPAAKLWSGVIEAMAEIGIDRTRECLRAEACTELARPA
jgi:protein-tyrosine-phosphatase